jgi:hypothetical protein
VTPGSDIPTDLSSQLRALKSGYFPGAAGYLPEMHRLSLYFNLTRANMKARSLLLITMQANSRYHSREEVGLKSSFDSL